MHFLLGYLKFLNETYINVPIGDTKSLAFRRREETCILVACGDIAVRVRDQIWQIAMEHELEIISGKVASDHIHLFLSYRAHQDISQIMHWLKGISSRVLIQEYPHLRKQFWGRHFWARGYLAVSSGTITDEMVKEYIDDQEGEQIADDSRFPIDYP